MMASKKQNDANQKAFERGQQDFRDGNSNNPYSVESTYHGVWEQGYESEREIHSK